MATFPALEYPRAAALPATHAVGPLLWEPPAGDVELPPGDEPLVLVAPSTSQDPDAPAAARGAARARRRARCGCSRAWNRRPLGEPIDVPAERAAGRVGLLRARRCRAATSSSATAGHGTLARALASGCAVVIVPAAGDMNENAARIDWAGVGVRVPRRLVRAAARCAWRSSARWPTPRMRERAGELAAWWRAHDPPARASELIEDLAG